MSQELIFSKIELLEKQIGNIEQSGYFTEKEIDRALFSMRCELENLKKQLNLYGMTPRDYIEGKKVHNQLFKKIDETTPERFNVFDIVSIIKRE